MNYGQTDEWLYTFKFRKRWKSINFLFSQHSQIWMKDHLHINWFVFSVHATLLEKNIFENGTRLGPMWSSPRSDPDVDLTSCQVLLKFLLILRRKVENMKSVRMDRRWMVSDLYSSLEPFSQARYKKKTIKNKQHNTKTKTQNNHTWTKHLAFEYFLAMETACYDCSIKTVDVVLLCIEKRCSHWCSVNSSSLTIIPYIMIWNACLGHDVFLYHS